MNKVIIESAKLMIRPFIDEVRKKYEDAARDQTLQKGSIPKKESSIKEEAIKKSDALQQFLLGEEELTRIEKGFELVLKELHKFPNKSAVLEDIMKAGERLLEEPKEPEVYNLPVYETLQEMFGLTKETYDTMYKIGADFFNEEKMEEACNVFIVLTNLNNFVFEPWLGLGSCWQIKERYPEALQAFSMASLLDFQNPAPHLYSAQVYLQLGSDRLARETLDLALSKMDKDKKIIFNSHIEYIKKNIKKK